MTSTGLGKPTGRPQGWLESPRLWTFVVAVCIAVTCGIVASSGDVGSWESSLFHDLNDLPDWLRPAMWVFQLAGLLAVPLLVAAVAAGLRRWRLAFGLVMLVPLKLLVEKTVVKQLVERERPGTTVCEMDVSCGEFRDVPLEGLSFVSGHAIIAWAVATLLWSELPAKWRVVPLAVAFANALARVYLGAHNPLDVIGGAAIGVALGIAIAFVVGLAPPRTRPSHRPNSTSTQTGDDQ